MYVLHSYTDIKVYDLGKKKSDEAVCQPHFNFCGVKERPSHLQKHLVTEF